MPCPEAVVKSTSALVFPGFFHSDLPHVQKQGNVTLKSVNCYRSPCAAVVLIRLEFVDECFCIGVGETNNWLKYFRTKKQVEKVHLKFRLKILRKT